MGYRISVDVGGTFTDLTLADGEAFLGRHKSPTTRQQGYYIMEVPMSEL